MVGLEVIKQSLESNKKGISPDLLKKIALLKIEERFQNSLNSYSIISMVERIADSDLDENDKQTLMKILKDGLDKTLSNMEDSIKELFGGSSKKEEDNENREEHKEEDNENREEHKEEPKQDHSENGLEGPRETPAENVINNNDENDHRVIFNY